MHVMLIGLVEVFHILAVSTPYQRKGLGTMLLKPCLGAAGENDRCFCPMIHHPCLS